VIPKVSEDIPKNWTSAKLGCIAQLIRGVSYKKNEGIHEPQIGYVPILRATNINKELNYLNLVYVPSSKLKEEQYVKELDIIIAMSSGSKNLVGKAAQAKHNFLGGFGAFCGLIRVNPKLNKKFIGYFFQNNAYNKSISQLSSGVNINNLRRENVLSIKLSLPPLPEQHRIVDKVEELFSRLDAGIESLKKVRTQIKRYRHAVLKHAFEGKLTAAWREANKHQLEPASAILEIFKTKGKKCIAKRQKNLPFPDTADLYELPDGWEWTSLHNIADMSSGKAFKKSEYAQTGVRLLQIANVSFGKIVWDNVSYLPSSYLEKHPKLVLKPGDILIALNRPILNDMLKIGILKDCDLPAILYQRVGRFDFFNTHVINKSYFFYLVQSPYFIRKVKISLQGVDQPFINKPALLKISVPLPPLLEQKKIVEEIERRFSIVDRVEEIVEQNLKKAERLRQSILKKAFEGKLVPQDPTDEPASVLLERIKAEKEKNATEKDQRRRSKK